MSVLTRAARAMMHPDTVREPDGSIGRDRMLGSLGISPSNFAKAAEGVGGKRADPAARFFDIAAGTIRFGPGAGLVLGVSVGSGSMRAALVDLNGTLHYKTGLEDEAGQLGSMESTLRRVREVSRTVVLQAFDDGELLVDGALPCLGASVAWPCPVDREKHAVIAGSADSRSLIERTASELEFERHRVHALNDVDAAAISRVFDYCTDPKPERQTQPELTLVLRVAGGVGGATVIIEAPSDPRDGYGAESGFGHSTLLGGDRTLAGEIGHLSVPEALVRGLRDQPAIAGLGPLKPVDCSCSKPGDDCPPHVEAYVSAAAVARRVHPDRPVRQGLAAVLEDQADPRHARAISDAARILGEALKGPVAWLNPTRIVITGSLAIHPFMAGVEQALSDYHPILNVPKVRIVRSRDENDFIRVRGAGLAVLRESVVRKLPEILDQPYKLVQSRVTSRTVNLRATPWA